MNLPAVGGRTYDGTLNWFEHRCRVYIEAEQKKVAPDNGLIAVLCDAVRVAREYADNRRAEPPHPPAEGVAQDSLVIPRAIAEAFAAKKSGEPVDNQLYWTTKGVLTNWLAALQKAGGGEMK